MTLYDNWRQILRRAWSMRFMYLASISNGAILITALVPDLLPRTWAVVIVLGVSTMVFNVLAMWSRLVYQRGIEHDARP